MRFSRTLRPATLDEKRSLIANAERLDKDGGSVEVLTIELKRFAIGEECNDEGPVLFFEVAQNQLLIIWGQWLYDPHVVITEDLDVDELWERNDWFKHFELVRSPLSGLVLSLKSIGRETVHSSGAVAATQCLPTQLSGVFDVNFDALMREPTQDLVQSV